MISSDDFPCNVSVYTQEKCDPVKEGLGVDEYKYFSTINAYMNWLVDVDAPPEPWEEV